MTARIRIAIACMGLLLTACNTLNHADAKKQAEQQWKHVRARIKYQLAEQQYLAQIYEEASHTAVESLALDPKQADAYVVLARSNLELSRIGSAQQALDTARAAGLESPDLIYTQGVILEQQDQIDLALQRYAEARTLDPSNVDFLVATAECLVAVGRAPEALSLLDEYNHRLDDVGTVAVLAAHVAALMGDTEGATQRLSHADVPAASRSMVAQELGVLLARAGKCAQAIAVLRPLLSRHSQASFGESGIFDRYRADTAGSDNLGGAARRALATCYLLVDDPAAALDALVDYAQGHPNDTLAQLLIAKAALATDDMVTALRAIDLLGRRAADHLEVKLLHAAIQWRRGNLAGASVRLEDLLEANPRDVEAHCLLAEILLEKNDLDAARIHLERALDTDPDCRWAQARLKSLG